MLSRFAYLFLFILFLAGLSPVGKVAWAAKIILKDGSQIEGNIVSKGDTYINIEQFGISVPYLLSEIVRIDGKSSSDNGYYENKDCGFSLQLPLGWELHQVQMGDILFYAYVTDPAADDSDKQRIYISAWKKDIPLRKMVREVVDDLFKRNMSVTGTPRIVSSPKSVTVSALPSETFEVSFNVLRDDWEKISINNALVKSYLFDFNGIMVLLDFVCHNDARMPAEWQVFEKTLNSIRSIPQKRNNAQQSS